MKKAPLSVNLFAKCPAKGRPKTRLQPPLTSVEASQLHMRLATHSLGVLQAVTEEPVMLWLDQASEHPWVAYMQTLFACEVHQQCNGDLGNRMSHTLRVALRSHEYAILIGSDCVALEPSHMQHALNLLQSGEDAVFIPTEDGGYALIGLRRHNHWLFSDMEWGTDRVMQETRERLRIMRWRWAETAPLWDVDRPEDLDRMVRANIALPYLPEDVLGIA